MSGYTPGFAAYKLAFSLSPIILTGGITESFPGFALPIMALTEVVNFPLSILSGSEGPSLDRFFANYQILPGSSLIQQDIGRYSFANATIAANAVITQPLTISYLMICPVQNKLGWLEKLGIISGLKWVFDQHNARGGTYILLTPSYIYTNCVMRGMHDASSQLTKQAQNTYQLDFEKPLLTQSDADSVLGGIANSIKTAAGAVTDVFGLAAPIATPASAALPSIVPTTVAQIAAQTINSPTSVAVPGLFGGANA